MSVTLSTLGSVVNFDSAALSGLANAGTITINNQATLLINSDMRWGQTARVPGAIATNVGGIYKLDGTTVQWVEFVGSTGTVPALGTVGTNDVRLTNGAGAFVGEFLGVWTALGTTPLTAGAALPFHGYVKFRSTVLSPVSGSTLFFVANSATVVTASAFQPGWIHAVHVQALIWNLAANTSVVSFGAWFQLGTIDGSYNQILQFPVQDQCPAVQVETGVGTNTYIWWTSAGPQGDATNDPTFKWGNGSMVAYQDIRGRFFGTNDSGQIEFYRRLSADPIRRYTTAVATITALPAGTFVAAAANSVGGTYTVTATGVLTIDGYATALNDRILVKNQASPVQNGIYTVTTAGAVGVQAVLTRATDWCRVSGAILANMTYVYSTNGATNAGLWFPLRNCVCPDTSTTVLFPGAEAIQLSPVRVNTAAVLPNAPTYAAQAYTATANAVLVVDGVTLTWNERVMVSQQADNTKNGIYVVTDPGAAGVRPWVLTRDTEFNTAAQPIPQYAYTNVRDGTTYKGQRWQLTAAVITIDTTAVVWGQISDSMLGTARAAGTTSTATALLFQYGNGTMGAMGLGCGTPGFGTAAAVATSPLTEASSTTTSITGTGLFPTVDGVSVWTASGTEASASKVLLTAQAAPARNGLYYLSANSTNWVLTRVAAMTTGTVPWVPLNNVFVYSGTVNANTWWAMTTTVNVVGTDAVSFANTPAPPFTAAAYGTTSPLPNSPSYSAPALTAGANAALVVDSVTPAVGDRILVAGQVTTTQNGLYVVTAVGSGITPWVLTRAADFDTPVQPIQQAREVGIVGGATLAGRKYYLDGVVTTIDTTAVLWVGAEFDPVGATTTAALLGTPTYSAGPATLSPSVGTNTPFTDVVWATAAALPNSPTYSNPAGTLTATAPVARLVINGVNVAVGDRVLVKNQVAALQNGIYVVTVDGTGSSLWVLTRATDFNTAAQPIAANRSVYVTGGGMTAVGGNTNRLTWWYLTTAVTTIGVNSATFTQTGLTVDGLNPAVGDRVLVKNQVTTADNGIYTVTTVGASYVLTRASDWSAAAQPLRKNRLVRVLTGATLAYTFWYLPAQVTTVATTAATLVQATALTLDSIVIAAQDNVFLTAAQLPATLSGLFRCVSNGPGYLLDRVANMTNARTPIYYGSYLIVYAMGTAFADVRLTTINQLPNFPTYGGGVLTATTNGTLYVDGLNVNLGDRILVKNQTTMTQNGLYVVTSVGSSSTAWTLTRASDFNASGIAKYQFVQAFSGLTQFNITYLLITPVTVLDTTPVIWIPYVIGGANSVSNDVQYSLRTTILTNQIDVTAPTWVSMRGSACGYPPPVGARVRIPNAILSATIQGTGGPAGAYNTNRIDFTWTNRVQLNPGNGPVDFSGATIALDYAISPALAINGPAAGYWMEQLVLTNSVLAEAVIATGIFQPLVVDNLAMSSVLPNCAVTGVPGTIQNIGPCLGGNWRQPGNRISNSRLSKLAPSALINVSTSYDVLVENVWCDLFVSSTATYEHASAGQIGVSVSGNYITARNITLVGGGISGGPTQSQFTNLVFADRHAGTTTSVNGAYVVGNGSAGNVYVSGISFLGDGSISNIHPYNGLLGAQGGIDMFFENVGTPTVPLDCGTPGFATRSMQNIVNNGNGGGIDENQEFQRLYLRNCRGSANGAGNSGMGIRVWNNVTLQSNPQIGPQWNITYSNMMVVRGWLGTLNGNIVTMDGPYCDTLGRVRISPLNRNDYINTAQYTLTGTAILPGKLPSTGDTVEWIGYYYTYGYTSIIDITYSEVNTANYTKTYMIDLNDGQGWQSALGLNTYDTLTIANLAAWVLVPAQGFRLRVKYAAAVGSATNAVTAIVFTLATSTANFFNPAFQQPRANYTWINLSGLVAGARVRLYNSTQSVEVTNANVSTTTYTTPLMACLSQGDTVAIQVVALGYLPYTGTLSLNTLQHTWNFAVTLQVDTVYVANGVNGALVTEYTASPSTSQIFINAPSNTSTVQRLYAWYIYTLTQSVTAMRSWMPSPALAAQNTTFYIMQGLYINNSNAALCRINGGYVYRSDNTTVVSPTTTGPLIVSSFAVFPLTGLDQTTLRFDSARDVYVV